MVPIDQAFFFFSFHAEGEKRGGGRGGEVKSVTGNQHFSIHQNKSGERAIKSIIITA